MKTAVITDSGSNIYYENLEIPADLFVVPLQVIDGETSYREGVDITILDTYEMVKNGKLLKTSLPILGDIEAKFREIKALGYERIFAVPITTGLSSTISAMKTIASQVDIVFDYFDCYTTARVQLECALKAVEMFKEDKEISEIKEVLQDMIDHSVTFVLPTDMDHLARGGRLTPLAAKLAGFLKINPVLYLNEETKGKIESFTKVRTMKKAMKVVSDYFAEHQVDERYRICVAHVLDKVSGEYMLNLLKQRFPKTDIYLTDLISVVGIHTGIGCIAVQYVKVRS